MSVYRCKHCPYTSASHWLLQEHELNRHVQNIKIDPNNPKAPNVRDGFKKKRKLMEFSIRLAGWVLDAPVFH